MPWPKSERVAIAEVVSRGKEQLVLIRPYRKGLVLHTMYYGDEVRDFNQVPKGETVNVSRQELELGVGLIDRLTAEEFRPENYEDEYRICVLGMLCARGIACDWSISESLIPRHSNYRVHRNVTLAKGYSVRAWVASSPLLHLQRFLLTAFLGSVMPALEFLGKLGVSTAFPNR